MPFQRDGTASGQSFKQGAAHRALCTAPTHQKGAGWKRQGARNTDFWTWSSSSVLCTAQLPEPMSCGGVVGGRVVLHGTATTQTVHNASPVATHSRAEHARTAGAYNPSSQTPSPLAHQAAIPCLRRAARQVGSPGQLGGGKANEGGHVDAHAAVVQPRHQVVECGAVLALKSGECRTGLGQPWVGAPRANAQEQIGL